MAKKLTHEEAMRQAQGEIKKALGKPKKPVCTCKNHMGTAKQQFRSVEAANAHIVRHHMWTGKSFRTYPCPKAPGIFHIASNGVFKKKRGER